MAALSWKRGTNVGLEWFRLLVACGMIYSSIRTLLVPVECGNPTLLGNSPHSEFTSEEGLQGRVSAKSSLKPNNPSTLPSEFRTSPCRQRVSSQFVFNLRALLRARPHRRTSAGLPPATSKDDLSASPQEGTDSETIGSQVISESRELDTESGRKHSPGLPLGYTNGGRFAGTQRPRKRRQDTAETLRVNDELVVETPTKALHRASMQCRRAAIEEEGIAWGTEVVSAAGRSSGLEAVRADADEGTGCKTRRMTGALKSGSPAVVSVAAESGPVGAAGRTHSKRTRGSRKRYRSALPPKREKTGRHRTVVTKGRTPTDEEEEIMSSVTRKNRVLFKSDGFWIVMPVSPTDGRAPSPALLEPVTPVTGPTADSTALVPKKQDIGVRELPPGYPSEKRRTRQVARVSARDGTAPLSSNGRCEPDTDPSVYPSGERPTGPVAVTGMTDDLPKLPIKKRFMVNRDHSVRSSQETGSKGVNTASSTEKRGQLPIKKRFTLNGDGAVYPSAGTGAVNVATASTTESMLSLPFKKRITRARDFNMLFAEQ